MQDAGWLQAAHSLHGIVHRASDQLHSTHLERADQPWDDKRRHCLLNPWKQCWAGSQTDYDLCSCSAAVVVVKVLDHAGEHWQSCNRNMLSASWGACQVGQDICCKTSPLDIVTSLQAPNCSESGAHAGQACVEASSALYMGRHAPLREGKRAAAHKANRCDAWGLVHPHENGQTNPGALLACHDDRCSLVRMHLHSHQHQQPGRAGVAEVQPILGERTPHIISCRCQAAYLEQPGEGVEGCV